MYDTLVERGTSRLHQAYRPKTRVAHLSHLKLVLRFSLYTSSPFPTLHFLLFWPLLRFCSLMVSILLPLLHTFILCILNLKPCACPPFHFITTLCSLVLGAYPLMFHTSGGSKEFLTFPSLTLSLLPLTPFL